MKPVPAREASAAPPDVGFALTVAYIVATILSPEQLGPVVAQVHPLLILAGITFLFSLPELAAHLSSRSSIQTFLLSGFIMSIALSGIANGWYGGIFSSWQEFLPSAAVFFFIVANVTSVRRLKILTLAAVAGCLVVVVEALCGYYSGFRGDLFVLQQNLSFNVSPVEAGIGQLARLRGAGFLNDPNDFAQILLIALPLLSLNWQKGRALANAMLVLAPAALLLWAIYLTHSRGALIALAVLTLMATRKRIGTTASAALIVALFVGMLALQFTGGRGISAADGADRLAAWASGLEMFKSAPLFGVGFGRFTDRNEITAHNSFVLCLAELGIVGSTLWIALLVTTMIGLNRIIAQAEADTVETAAGEDWKQAGETDFPEFPHDHAEPRAMGWTGRVTASEAEPDLESSAESILPKHWAIAVRMALIAFMTTGWFLSRSYRMPMYLAIGLATATIAPTPSADEGSVPRRWVFLTLLVEASAILCIYGMVRL